MNDPRTAQVFDHDGTAGPFYRMLANSMLFLEKPEHDRVRRLVYRAFTPRAVAPLGPLTESVAHDLLDAVEARKEMDFVDRLLLSAADPRDLPAARPAGRRTARDRAVDVGLRSCG